MATFKPQCASGVRRTIDRWEDEAVLERMAKRLAAGPTSSTGAARRLNILRHHQTVDEPGRLPMRRLANVNAEFSLTALAYNLRRAINISHPALLRAVRA
jgi:transposase